MCAVAAIPFKGGRDTTGQNDRVTEMMAPKEPPQDFPLPTHCLL